MSGSAARVAIELDRDDVVREVAAEFARYEAALSAGDQAVLGELFWGDDRVVRYGFGENLYGKAEIDKFRRIDSSGPKERSILKQQITTFGDRFAVVNAEISSHNGENRQSQTWVKFQEGWKIVSAHVSRIQK